MKSDEKRAFQQLNRGYQSVFQYGRMSVGLVAPVENYLMNPVPSMKHHLERIQLAEELGFSAVWLRDVPFNVPSFGDAGQVFDPFVYLGYLAAQTENIALGVASIVLPLRHPAHVAKSAASVDALSNGRLILGVASGDRPEEYPAMNLSYEDRGYRFRESFEYIRHMQKSSPAFSNLYGQFKHDMDLLPKPTASKLPILVTGGSQQDKNWIAKNSDGWMVYPHQVETQQHIISDWNKRLKDVGNNPQPVMQPLYFDWIEQGDDKPKPLHLGFRSGISYLKDYLKALESIGVNHVALNLRFNQRNSVTTLEKLAEEILADFPQQKIAA